MSFDGIAEAQPLWRRLIVDPATGVAFALPALAAVAVSVKAIFSAKGESRIDWLIVTGFLLVAVVTMLFVMRGARFAAAFSVPAAAYLIADRPEFLHHEVRGAWHRGPRRKLAALRGRAAVCGRRVDFAPCTDEAASPLADVGCFRAADYNELATLPPRKVMAPIRISSHILRYTPHSIVSAGFHRNTEGTHRCPRLFRRGRSSGTRHRREATDRHRRRLRQRQRRETYRTTNG